VSVYSTTDYWVGRQAQHQLPQLRARLEAALRRRVEDSEFAVRNRRVAELQRVRVTTTDEPTPQWVIDLRRRINEAKKRTPRVIIGGVEVTPLVRHRKKAAGGLAVDFRPDIRPRYELTLTHGARQAIEDEVRLFAPHRRETGGFLWAHQRPRLGYADIQYASGPAPGSLHGRRTVILGEPEDVEATFGEFTRRARFVWAGCWHTHPSGSPNPSELDRETWAVALKRSGWTRYVSVIVTPSDDSLGWMFPRLHAWVMHAHAGGRPHTLEPARIKE
jgi:proteasome lid subunit RPN8/RPN11